MKRVMTYQLTGIVAIVMAFITLKTGEGASDFFFRFFVALGVMWLGYEAIKTDKEYHS